MEFKTLSLLLGPEAAPSQDCADLPGAPGLALLRYENLGFKLRQPVLLRNCQLVCLAGPSGLGKSTLLEALAGLHDDPHWHIQIDGNTPVRALSQDRLGRVFSVVYHDTDIFMDTLEFNVTLGQAAGPAGASRYASLCNALGLNSLRNTICHPNTLSSGEKLRIGIARGLYRHCAIYLFDEPTTNLDDEGVACVIELLLELKSRHLVVCTSHDARLLRRADLCLAFQDGLISPA